MTDKTYNGWSTYETWLVNLWLTNDMQDDDLIASVKEVDTTYEAKEILKDYVEEMVETSGVPDNGLVHDLLHGALSEVNWYEIVKNWRGETE